ncbi:pyridoxal phosphate-dependent aminotransferase [Nocardia sp. NEAU-351]|uniref:Aminotransferase n=2 Tax=Nocardia bovistercoris TaxID=2785916 RepID=A0A931IGE8_9NOCA|nr:pyridoxal phosphate-dependent aminotransferase [Nocardia bovistercoris]
MASGEIGLPAHPELRDRLAAAADVHDYGPVAGSPELLAAAAGYWNRRGIDADPGLVVAGPGSKPLLFGLLLAIGGDVVVPVPSWVSYAAQIRLVGARPIPVPIRPGQGGVPDPDLLRAAVREHRAAGRDVRAVVVTVPDNPTGTFPTPETTTELISAALDLDLIIISDEIYCDLVFGPAPVSPARLAPERTVVTTGLTKSFALGGWRIGIARLPDAALRERLAGVASQIWSSPVAPIQRAAAYAFDEPPELVDHVAAARGLHEAVARAVAEKFTAVGAALAPVRATCYLYPDLEPLRAELGRRNIDSGADFTDLLLARHGIGLLPAAAFGEPERSLRVRASVSRLYGDTDDQRRAALAAEDPVALPWIRDAVHRIGSVLTAVTGR